MADTGYNWDAWTTIDEAIVLTTGGANDGSKAGPWEGVSR